MSVVAVIPAAGSGRRMGAEVSKQFLRIGSKPILFYTLQRFERVDEVDEVILVVREQDLMVAAQEIVDRYGIQKVRKIVPGGAERQDSVFSGLKAIDGEPELVVIHDAVRPLVSEQLIRLSIQHAREHGAVITAVPVSSTIKRVAAGKVIETVNREELWEVQTPQVFRFELILTAYESAAAEGYRATDDAALVERLGMGVRVLAGEKSNIKITTPEDLALAEFLLQRRK